MKKHFSLLLATGVVLFFALSVSAKDVDTKGKAWLDTHKDPATINVNGKWHAREWGRVTLIQSEGSREVTGDGDGWKITGVVSGNQIFLLFHNRGKVNYTAELTAQGDSKLDGSYSRGFMTDKTKHKPMLLTKE